MPAVTAKQPIQSLCGAMQSASERFLLPARLVAEHRQPAFAAFLVGDPDVVALRARREDPHGGLQREQPFVADAGQQGLGVGEDLARFGAFFRGGRGFRDSVP